jgi:hypothetical protein
MAETENININIKTNVELKSVKDYREEIKQLNIELQKAAAAGDTKLFDKLSRSLGEAKNDLSDFNAKLKYSDPGEFLAGTIKLAQGVTGAFSTVTATMNLAGLKNEELNAIMGKTAAAIQLLQGLESARQLVEGKGIAEGLAGQVKRLLGIGAVTTATNIETGAIVTQTVAQRALNIAKAGLIGLGIAAAIYGIYKAYQYLTKGTKEAYQSALDLFNLQQKIKKQSLTLTEQYIQQLKEIEEANGLDQLQIQKNITKNLSTEIKSRLDERKDYEKQIADLTKEANEKEIADDFTRTETKKERAARVKRDELKAEQVAYDAKTKALEEANTKQLKQLDLANRKDTVNTQKKNKDAVDIKKQASIDAVDIEIEYQELLMALNEREQDEIKEIQDKRTADAEEAAKKRLAYEIEYQEKLKQLRYDGVRDDEGILKIKIENLKIEKDKELQYFIGNQEARLLIEKKYNYLIQAEWKTYIDKKIEALQDLNSMYEKYTTAQNTIDQSRYDADIKRMDDKKRAEVDRINLVAKTDEEKKTQLDLLDKKYSNISAQRKRELDKEQAKRTYNAAIANIALNTIQSISKAWSQYGWPLGAVAAGVLVGIGAKQAQAAREQKNAMMAKRGMLVGASHENGGIAIEGENGEAILNKRSMSIPAFRAIASAMNVSTGGVPLTPAVGTLKSAAALDLSNNTIKQIASAIGTVPVIVTERDISEKQRKVKVIENRSRF